MSDVVDFGVWMYNGVTRGPTQLYGVGGWPPEARVLAFDGAVSQVDYPPLALYELSGAGFLYRSLGGKFRSLKDLVVPIKLLAVSAGAGLSFLLWYAARRRGGPAVARMAAVAYWANPAVILHSAFLGYVGSLAALPAVGALLAAHASWTWTSGALLAVAILTKPQGILVAPAIAIALARSNRVLPLLKAAAGAAAAAVIIVLPVIAAGGLTNMCYALGRLISDGTLSAQAANIWWLVGYAIDVVRHVDRLGPSAFLLEARILSLEDVLEVRGSAFGTFLRAWGIAVAAWTMVALAVGWASWRARARNDFTTTVGLGAFTVHAYFTLAVQVHENHMFLTLPLVALVAADHQAYRRLFVALSTIVALNLFLFYGVGGANPPVPPTVTFVDATVLLALANVGAFVWHTRIFAAQCRPAQPRPAV